MKTINVLFAYRNYKPIHPIYRSLYDNPPEGVKYSMPVVKKKPKMGFKIYRRFGENKLVRRLISTFQRYYLERNTMTQSCDLVHVIDFIPTKYQEFPFVVDIGHIDSLVGFGTINKDEARKIITFLTHKNCKAIIARTKASKKSIERFATEFVSDKNTAKLIIGKITVVYPSAKPSAEKPKTYKNNKLSLLFIGEKPYNKGLHELILAYERLCKSGIKIQLTAISNNWEELSEEYKKDNIEFLKAEFSRTDIIKIFKNTDIFVMPSHSDIFGMVHLEAFSTATPVIAANQYSTNEIVEHGRTGFLVNTDKKPLDQYPFPSRKAFLSSNFEQPEEKVVDELCEYINKLYIDRNLARRMSKNALETISNGKFSQGKRNKSLRELYEKALV